VFGQNLSAVFIGFRSQVDRAAMEASMEDRAWQIPLPDDGECISALGACMYGLPNLGEMRIGRRRTSMGIYRPRASICFRDW